MNAYDAIAFTLPLLEAAPSVNITVFSGRHNLVLIGVHNFMLFIIFCSIVTCGIGSGESISTKLVSIVVSAKGSSYSC